MEKIRNKRQKSVELSIKRPYFPLEGNISNYQLFGIPIRSPTEYYNFLEKYFNWRQQSEIEMREDENNKIKSKRIMSYIGQRKKYKKMRTYM